MITLARRQNLATTALFDALLLAGVALVPSLAHELAFPVYRFEPMRLALFTGLLWTGRRNGFLLALVMPLVAYLTAGHPAPPKLMLIQVELVANVWLYDRGLALTRRFAVAAAVSTIVSKLAYYGLKYLLIEIGWLGGRLVSTDWRAQLAVLVLIVGGGQLVWTAQRRPDR